MSNPQVAPPYRVNMGLLKQAPAHCRFVRRLRVHHAGRIESFIDRLVR
jgi:hypothetical protein